MHIHPHHLAVSIHGAHHAWCVPLDIRFLQHALTCMADHILHDDALLMPTCPTKPCKAFCSALPPTAEAYDDNTLLCTATSVSALSGSVSSVYTHEAVTPVCADEAMFCALTSDLTGIVHAELSLTLVRDAEMWSVNTTHMDCASPTNILSFPSYSPLRAGSLVQPAGDMLLAVDTVRREALLYGQNPPMYTLALLAHGVAHLAGLDHGNHMAHLEQRLISSIV